MMNLTRTREGALKTRLAKERQMTSLLEREIVPASGAIQPNRENWVRMWVDTGHVVRGDRPGVRATRGIDDRGQLMWLVHRDGKALGYHATAADPVAAIEQAEAAWAHRKAVRQRWREVEALARDLRSGRRSFDVRFEDAAASPLCEVGIRAFLRRVGLSPDGAISGWFAAQLMRVEPQVGFVIYEAARRAEAQAYTARDTASSSGSGAQAAVS